MTSPAPNDSLQTKTDNFNFQVCDGVVDKFIGKYSPKFISSISIPQYISRATLQRIIGDVQQGKAAKKNKVEPTVDVKNSNSLVVDTNDSPPYNAIDDDDLNLSLDQLRDEEEAIVIERASRSILRPDIAASMPVICAAVTPHKQINTASSRRPTLNSVYSDRIVVTKITTFQQNIQCIIDNILYVIVGQCESLINFNCIFFCTAFRIKLQKQRWHNGEVDLERRGKRFSAFLILFNRNFLYSINRMVSEDCVEWSLLSYFYFVCISSIALRLQTYGRLERLRLMHQKWPRCTVLYIKVLFCIYAKSTISSLMGYPRNWAHFSVSFVMRQLSVLTRRYSIRKML